MRGTGRRTAWLGSGVWLLMLTGLVACAGAPESVGSTSGLPVEVVGDGEPDVVLSACVVPCGGEQPLVCERASDNRTWRGLCDRFALGALGAHQAAVEAAASVEQVVFVPVPVGASVVGVVVSSDEGVDVVTVDCVGSGDGRLSPVHNCDSCCLLEVARRTCQLAIILRDEPRGVEQTLAVFSGL